MQVKPRRMERGDPSVAFGIHAMAFWMMARAQAIPKLVAPQFDLGAWNTRCGSPSSGLCVGPPLLKAASSPQVQSRLN